MTRNSFSCLLVHVRYLCFIENNLRGEFTGDLCILQICKFWTSEVLTTLHGHYNNSKELGVLWIVLYNGTTPKNILPLRPLEKIQVIVVILSLFEEILWQSISDLELIPAIKPTKTLAFGASDGSVSETFEKKSSVYTGPWWFVLCAVYLVHVTVFPHIPFSKFLTRGPWP